MNGNGDVGPTTFNLATHGKKDMRSGVVLRRLGGRLLRSGTGLLTLGLTTGLGLILHYFYVTPFEICSASLATASVFDVWPWALPLLATEGLALALITSGLCLMSQSRAKSALSFP